MAQYTYDDGSAHHRARVVAFTSLTTEEEIALAKAFAAGDARAGARLIECNLRHVYGIAREYRRWAVPMDDLLQQGSIGLLKAAQRFDPSMNTTLRSYAAYWIRAEIRDYVVRCFRIVRVGTTRSERRALRAFRTSSVQTVEELAERSGMPEARCRLLWPLLHSGDRSLDVAPVGGAPGRDLLHDERPDPESCAVQRETKELTTERVQRALALLSERERHILWSRMAADDPRTLEQIGAELGVSRERVRQLESRARTKFRDALTSDQPQA